MEILYNDADCVVAVKPAGLLSEAGEGSFPAALQEHLASKGEPCALYAVHRLDRAVSGVMVYAKNKETAAALSRPEALKEKTYLTVVRGKTEQAEGVLTDFLWKDSRQNKVFVVKSLRKGAKEAVLCYKTLRYDPDSDLSLLSVTLQTGRTHQIRVQFSSRKHPVVGDGKYGGGDNAAKHVALFSARLRFGLRGEEKTFCADPPQEFPFSLFFGQEKKY